MTRAIIDIYNDLNDLVKQYDPSDLRYGGVGVYAHTGDSQIIHNGLLSTMFSQLMSSVKFLEKTNVPVEPYAPAVKYIFDTNWWGITNAQAAERDAFYKDGYDNGYRDGFFSSSTLHSRWYVDENSQFKQKEGCFETVYVYNNGITGTPPEPPKDRYRIADLYDWSKGDFFHPNLVKIETQTQLNAWLDAFDEVLTKMKACTVPAELKVPTTVAGYGVSDRLLAQVTYDETSWYDDLTGDSGEMVQERIYIKNLETAEIIDVYVYSEQRTVSVIIGFDPDPPYDPIYGTFTYNTTDPETGLSFGTTALQARGYGLGNFTDTHTAGYATYYYNKSTQELLGNDYDNEDYTQNFTKTIKTIEQTRIDVMSVKPDSSQYYTVTDKTWIQSATPWTSALLSVSEDDKEPSLIANRFIVDESIESVDYAFPNYGTEDIVSYLDTSKMIEGVDLSEYTVHQLSAPE